MNGASLNADDIDEECAVVAVDQTVHWEVRDSSNALVAELAGSAVWGSAKADARHAAIYYAKS